MRYIITIIIVFLIAFGLSTLLELDFIAKNWLRYSLVVLLVFLVLIAGIFYLREYAKESKNKK